MDYVYSSFSFALAFFVYKSVWKGKLKMEGNYCLERKVDHKAKYRLQSLL